MRLSPNFVTLLSLPFSLLGALFLYQGSFSHAVFFIALLGSCDMLDGYLAKKKGQATPFGAFLDSTIDRIAELFLFMGILFFYLREGSFGMAAVAYWTMGGSLVISYTRARAENLIENCRVGFWERPERIGLILLGLLSGRLNSALWILALGVTLTALHRILHTRRVLRNQVPSTLQKILFLDYPRKSWPYKIFVLFVLLLVFFLPQ